MTNGKKAYCFNTLELHFNQIWRHFLGKFKTFTVHKQVTAVVRHFNLSEKV